MCTLPAGTAHVSVTQWRAGGATPWWPGCHMSPLDAQSVRGKIGGVKFWLDFIAYTGTWFF